MNATNYKKKHANNASTYGFDESELAARQTRACDWFQTLRNAICADFEAIEADHTGPMAHLPAGAFKRKTWNRADGGGGEMSLMHGRVFEKVGVNISTVHGEFSENFRSQIPGAEENPSFWAAGISLVAHPQSPLVPAVHMNTRFICTTKQWFGGGADLTPNIPNAEDTADFHAALHDACRTFSADAYDEYKKWCDEYFFIPHRNVARGVGGIFYDYVNTGDWERDFAFTQEVGKAFRAIYPQLVRRHMDEAWNQEQREQQLRKRGLYAEFNLVYDRGTKFGLMTGGNPEAILMSLPPVAKWV